MMRSICLVICPKDYSSPDLKRLFPIPFQPRSFSPDPQKHNTVAAGKNILVTAQANAQGGTEYTVATKPDVTFDSVTVGNVKVNSSGISAGNQKITNVAPGEVSATSTDAVNGSQLYGVQSAVNQNSQSITNIGQRIGELNEDIAKVGATSAAIAALHPTDFDPEHRFMLSAGLGHYKSRTGVAVGAFLYPTDTGNLLLSLGYASSASDSHMVNAGLTYRFGGDSKTKLSAMTAEGKYYAVLAENRDLSSKVESLKVLNDSAVEKNRSLESRIDALQGENRAIREELARIKAALNLK